jgi:hypothetical protein
MHSDDVDPVSTIDEYLAGLSINFDSVKWKLKSISNSNRTQQQKSSSSLPSYVATSKNTIQYASVPSKLEKLKFASLSRCSLPLPPLLNQQPTDVRPILDTQLDPKLAPVTSVNEALSILGLSTTNKSNIISIESTPFRQLLNAVATILHATMQAQLVQSHSLQCRLRTINLHINFHTANIEISNKSSKKQASTVPTTTGAKHKSVPSPWLSGAASAQTSKHRAATSSNAGVLNNKREKESMVRPSIHESIDELQKLEGMKIMMLERLVLQCLKNKTALSRLQTQLVKACVARQNKQLASTIFKHWKSSSVVEEKAVKQASGHDLTLSKRHALRALSAWHDMAQYNGHLGQVYALHCKFQRQQALKAVLCSWRYQVVDKKLAMLTSCLSEGWRRKTTVVVVFGRWRGTVLRLQHQKAALLYTGGQAAAAMSHLTSSIIHNDRDNNGDYDRDEATVPCCSISPAAGTSSSSSSLYSVLLDEELRRRSRLKNMPALVQLRNQVAASKALLQSLISGIFLPVGLVPQYKMAHIGAILEEEDEDSDGMNGSSTTNTNSADFVEDDTRGSYFALGYTSPVKKHDFGQLGDDADDNDDVDTLEEQLFACCELLQQCERDCFAAEQESKELSVVSLNLQTELVEAEHGLDRATHALSAAEQSANEAMLNMQIARDAVDRAVSAANQANAALENAQHAYELARTEVGQAQLDVATSEDALDKSKNEVIHLRRVITGISKELDNTTTTSKQRPIIDARLKDAAAALDKHHKRIEKVMLQLEGAQQAAERAQENVHCKADEVSVAQSRAIEAATTKMEAQQVLQDVEKEYADAQEGLSAAEEGVKDRLAECQVLVGQLNVVKNQDRRTVGLSIRLREKVALLEQVLVDLQQRHAEVVKRQLFQKKEEGGDALMPNLQQQEEGSMAICVDADAPMHADADQDEANNDAYGFNVADDSGEEEEEDELVDGNTNMPRLETTALQLVVTNGTTSQYSTPATSPRAVRAVSATTSHSHHVLSQMTSMDAAAIRSRTCVLKRCMAAFRLQLQHAYQAEQRAQELCILKVGLPALGGWRCQTELDKEWREETRGMLLMKMCLKSWVRVAKKETVLAALCDEGKRHLEMKSKRTIFTAWTGVVLKEKKLDTAMSRVVAGKKRMIMDAWRACVGRSKMLRERVAEWQQKREDALFVNSWQTWKQAVKIRRTIRNVLNFAVSIRAREVGEGKKQADREAKAAVMHVWRVAVLMGQLERRRAVWIDKAKGVRERRLKKWAMGALRRHAKDPLMGLELINTSPTGNTSVVSPLSLYSSPPASTGDAAALDTASIKLDSINWDLNVSSWEKKAEVWRKKQRS